MVQQSITIYQSYGNRSGAAATYSNLGILAASQQDLAKAHDNFSLSLAIREALGDSLGIAITRNNLGQLEKDRGRLTDAMNHLKMATKVARNSDLTQVLAQSLSNLGLVEMLSGKLPEAITTLDEAKLLCQSYNFQNLLCEVQWKQASCYLDLGSFKKAEKTAISAIELATELESQDLKSESQRVLSRIYRKMSDEKRSLSLAKEAWEIREGDPNHIVRARFAGEYALSLIANGDLETAKRIYENEIEKFDLNESSSIMQELNEALG
jgi:tetratricopeptide (TPR) repeat protein